MKAEEATVTWDILVLLAGQSIRMSVAGSRTEVINRVEEIANQGLMLSDDDGNVVFHPSHTIMRVSAEQQTPHEHAVSKGPIGLSEEADCAPEAWTREGALKVVQMKITQLLLSPNICRQSVACLESLAEFIEGIE